MKVLVTGGAGYIGSITAKALEEAGHTPVILDSLLTGPRVFVKDRIFYEGDIAEAERRFLLTRHPAVEDWGLPEYRHGTAERYLAMIAEARRLSQGK